MKNVPPVKALAAVTRRGASTMAALQCSTRTLKMRVAAATTAATQRFFAPSSVLLDTTRSSGKRAEWLLRRAKEGAMGVTDVAAIVNQSATSGCDAVIAALAGGIAVPEHRLSAMVMALPADQQKRLLHVSRARGRLLPSSIVANSVKTLVSCRIMSAEEAVTELRCCDAADVVPVLGDVCQVPQASLDVLRFFDDVIEAQPYALGAVVGGLHSAGEWHLALRFAVKSPDAEPERSFAAAMAMVGIARYAASQQTVSESVAVLSAAGNALAVLRHSHRRHCDGLVACRQLLARRAFTLPGALWLEAMRLLPVTPQEIGDALDVALQVSVQAGLWERAVAVWCSATGAQVDRRVSTLPRVAEAGAPWPIVKRCASLVHDSRVPHRRLPRLLAACSVAAGRFNTAGDLVRAVEANQMPVPDSTRAVETALAAGMATACFSPTTLLSAGYWSAALAQTTNTHERHEVCLAIADAMPRVWLDLFDADRPEKVSFLYAVRAVAAECKGNAWADAVALFGCSCEPDMRPVASVIIALALAETGRHAAALSVCQAPVHCPEDAAVLLHSKAIDCRSSVSVDVLVRHHLRAGDWAQGAALVASSPELATPLSVAQVSLALAAATARTMRAPLCLVSTFSFAVAHRGRRGRGAQNHVCLAVEPVPTTAGAAHCLAAPVLTRRRNRLWIDALLALTSRKSRCFSARELLHVAHRLHDAPDAVAEAVVLQAGELPGSAACDVGVAVLSAVCEAGGWSAAAGVFRALGDLRVVPPMEPVAAAFESLERASVGDQQLAAAASAFREACGTVATLNVAAARLGQLRASLIAGSWIEALRFMLLLQHIGVHSVPSAAVRRLVAQPHAGTLRHLLCALQGMQRSSDKRAIRMAPQAFETIASVSASLGILTAVDVLVPCTTGTIVASTTGTSLRRHDASRSLLRRLMRSDGFCQHWSAALHVAARCTPRPAASTLNELVQRIAVVRASAASAIVAQCGCSSAGVAPRKAADMSLRSRSDIWCGWVPSRATLLCVAAGLADSNQWMAALALLDNGAIAPPKDSASHRWSLLVKASILATRSAGDGVDDAWRYLLAMPGGLLVGELRKRHRMWRDGRGKLSRYHHRSWSGMPFALDLPSDGDALRVWAALRDPATFVKELQRRAEDALSRR